MRRPLVASYFSSMLSTKSNISKLIWQVIVAPQFLREKIHKLSKDKSASLTSKAEQSGRSILVSDALGVLLFFPPRAQTVPIVYHRVTQVAWSPQQKLRHLSSSPDRLTPTLFFLSVTEQKLEMLVKASTLHHSHFQSLG